MGEFHTSVLLQESIDFLNVRPGKKYIDATLGGGGHSFEILKRGGIVLGIDVDEEAIEHVKNKLTTDNLRPETQNLILARGNFKDIKEIARLHNFDTVCGILFDLGASSFQFDKGQRGFSFTQDAPVDMRMDPGLAVKAGDLVNGLTKGELYELFYTLGEERYARTIADSIVRSRRIKPIETTTELASIIKWAVPKSGAIHPATRVFQALRIAVNDELNSLQDALPQAFDLLESRARMVVITFHSLEDRIVKNAFKTFSKDGTSIVLTKKPVTPSFAEIETNRRARSAKLRAIEKL